MTDNITYTTLEVKPLRIWSIDYLKNYLRIAHDYDDELIMSLLDTSIEMAENYTGLSLNRKIIKLIITQAPCVIQLKYVPILDIQSMSEIRSSNSKFFNFANTRLHEENLTRIDINFDNLSLKGDQISIDKSLIGKNLEVVYSSGYCLNKESKTENQQILNIAPKTVPFPIQTAILLLLERFYEKGIEDNMSYHEAIRYLLPYRHFKL